MGSGSSLFYDEPIELTSGDGVWLTAANGTKYLDLYNNVPTVGHANPRVVEAIAKQAATLNVHSRYLHENVVEYVERLMSLHHDGIESAILACSGTEATELAIRIARGATGNSGIICTDATYHGNSVIVGQLTRLPPGQARGSVRSITTPEMYRPPATGLSETQLNQHYLEELQHVIDTMTAEPGGFAGMMLCSILANEGVPDAPSGWFHEATEIVRRAGGLVIADEVQAGFARSGNFWGYETMGFVPDIVCMGKPMGNGVPISAVAASHELISDFRHAVRYFNTYASSPLQAAAGMAVLDEIIDRELVASVRHVGSALKGALQALQPSNPAMGDVRGTGLFLGIDWVHPGTTDPDAAGATAMVEALKTRGMLLGTDGPHDNVVKIRPPLVFQPEHVDLFLHAFEGASSETTSSV
jgi:4-aminobutyrate aminotransferase-like enzyme